MINVTNSFLDFIKKDFKVKNISLSDYVFCFSCGDMLNVDKSEENKFEVSLKFLIVPISAFEEEEKERKIPFDRFIIYKKNDLWLSCNLEAYFHLVNTQVSINKDGIVVLKKTKDGNKNSLSCFIGKCLFEHMKKEKLTKKELANNLSISVYKLEKIFKGSSSHIGISEMVSISFEFEGKNKISSKYFVIIEKTGNDKYKKSEKLNYEEEDYEEIEEEDFY